MSDFIYDDQYQAAVAEDVAERLADVIPLLSEGTLVKLCSAITLEYLKRVKESNNEYH